MGAHESKQLGIERAIAHCEFVAQMAALYVTRSGLELHKHLYSSSSSSSSSTLFCTTCRGVRYLETSMDHIQKNGHY